MEKFKAKLTWFFGIMGWKYIKEKISDYLLSEISLAAKDILAKKMDEFGTMTVQDFRINHLNSTIDRIIAHIDEKI